MIQNLKKRQIECSSVLSFTLGRGYFPDIKTGRMQTITASSKKILKMLFISYPVTNPVPRTTCFPRFDLLRREKKTDSPWIKSRKTRGSFRVRGHGKWRQKRKKDIDLYACKTKPERRLRGRHEQLSVLYSPHRTELLSVYLPFYSRLLSSLYIVLPCTLLCAQHAYQRISDRKAAGRLSLLIYRLRERPKRIDLDRRKTIS